MYSIYVYVHCIYYIYVYNMENTIYIILAVCQCFDKDIMYQ